MILRATRGWQEHMSGRERLDERWDFSKLLRWRHQRHGHRATYCSWGCVENEVCRDRGPAPVEHYEVEQSDELERYIEPCDHLWHQTSGAAKMECGIWSRACWVACCGSEWWIVPGLREVLLLSDAIGNLFVLARRCQSAQSSQMPTHMLTIRTQWTSYEHLPDSLTDYV